MQYLPLTLRWDASSRKDATGVWTRLFGFGLQRRIFSGGLFAPPNHADKSADLFHRAAETGSLHSPMGTGSQLLTANLARDQVIYSNWSLTLRADGHRASEPLINNEQFGIGRRSECPGLPRRRNHSATPGWHVIRRAKDAGTHRRQHRRHHPLIFPGSIYMDYAETLFA